jgi:hypothetical protein
VVKPTLKRCTKCGNDKIRDTDFFKDKRGSARSNCKACAAREGLAWRKANPDRHRAIYQKTNHRIHVKKRFGLEVEQFDALFAACNGVCCICLKPESRARRLSLDHNHETGALRGFLCSRCNIFLGSVKDDAELLDRAAHYLRTARLEIPATVEGHAALD